MKKSFLILLLMLFFLILPITANANTAQNHIKTRLYKTGIIIENLKGEKLLEKRFKEKPDAVFAKEGKIYIFWKDGIIRVFIFNAPLSIKNDVSDISLNYKLKEIQNIKLESKIINIEVENNKIIITTAEPVISIYNISKTGLNLWKKGTLKQTTTKPKISPKEQLKGVVIGIKKGKVIFNKGTSDGFETGDIVEIISRKSVLVYNPISDKVSKKKSGKTVAQLVINKVEEHKSYAEIQLGDDISVGDFFKYLPRKKPLKINPYHKWNMKSVSFNLYPGFLIGDSLLGMNVKWDYRNDWSHFSAEGFYQNVFKKFHQTYVDFKVGLRGDYFEIGLGLLFGNFIKAFIVDSYVRLGSLNGINLEVGLRAGTLVLNGMWLRFQLPIGWYNNLFMSFDICFSGDEPILGEPDNDPNYDSSENANSSSGGLFRFYFGDSIRLWGSGGPGSVYIPIYIGYHIQSIDDQDSYSFIFGAGMEYRY